MQERVGTSNRSARTLAWSWHDGRSQASVPAWVSEIRALRSRVLYDEGRRPRFQPGSAGDGDPDPLDLQSFHVAVRDDGILVGCVRITPIGGPLPCATEQFIGAERWGTLLGHMAVPSDQIVEHGRWVAAREYKDIGTGLYLMCLSFALAYKLGYTSSVATASIDVVEMLERAGARRAPDLAPVHSEHYAGDAIVLYGHQREFSPSVLQQFERTAALLRICPVYTNARGLTSMPQAKERPPAKTSARS
jgi:hypothetical protein